MDTATRNRSATTTARSTLVAASTPDGLSGLTTGNNGTLWAIPEEARAIVEIELTGMTNIVPIVGVPAGLETEALAWIQDGRFALGTESDVPGRALDVILIVERNGHRYEVREHITFSYAAWSLNCAPNVGVEGLCYASERLVAAGESVIRDPTGRFAPIGQYDTGRQRWHASRLRLTSETGKVSALACRRRGEGIEYVAVERDFGILRLLRWATPGIGLPAEIRPEVVRDLSAEVSVNVEGVTWLDEQRLALVTDNQYRGRRDAPGHLLVVPLYQRLSAGSR